MLPVGRGRSQQGKTRFKFISPSVCDLTCSKECHMQEEEEEEGDAKVLQGQRAGLTLFRCCLASVGVEQGFQSSPGRQEGGEGEEEQRLVADGEEDEDGDEGKDGDGHALDRRLAALEAEDERQCQGRAENEPAAELAVEGQAELALQRVGGNGSDRGACDDEDQLELQDPASTGQARCFPSAEKRLRGSEHGDASPDCQDTAEHTVSCADTSALRRTIKQDDERNSQDGDRLGLVEAADCEHARDEASRGPERDGADVGPTE